MELWSLPLPTLVVWYCVFGEGGFGGWEGGMVLCMYRVIGEGGGGGGYGTV